MRELRFVLDTGLLRISDSEIHWFFQVFQIDFYKYSREETMKHIED